MKREFSQVLALDVGTFMGDINFRWRVSHVTNLGLVTVSISSRLLFFHLPNASDSRTDSHLTKILQNVTRVCHGLTVVTALVM